MLRPTLLMIVLLALVVVAPAQKSFTLDKGTTITMRLVADNVGYPGTLTQETNGMLWMSDRFTGRVLRIDPGTGATTTVLEVKLTSDPKDPSIVGGVYGIALHPAFANGMPFVFVSTTTADNRLIIEKYRFNGVNLINPEIIYATNNVPHLLGLTMKILADNTLLVSVGSYDTQDPVRLDVVNGKLIRMTLDGDAVPSNPMYDRSNPHSARSYIYTWGHRNPLGIAQVPVTSATNPGAVYSTECGPLSFDEVNRIEAGKNYGWLNTAGYLATPPNGLTCPLATLNQAPSGLAYYPSSAIPEWTNTLLMGTLRGNGMVVAELDASGAVSNIDASRPSDDVMVLGSGQLIDLSMDGESERIIDLSVSVDGRVYAVLYESGGSKHGRLVALENPAVHGPLSVDDNDYTSSNGFRFGPNPTTEVLTLSLDAPFTSTWSATIIDLTGRVVDTQSYSPATSQVAFSTAALSSGAYMLVVKDATTTKTVTFIR